MPGRLAREESVVRPARRLYSHGRAQARARLAGVLLLTNMGVADPLLGRSGVLALAQAGRRNRELLDRPLPLAFRVGRGGAG